MICWTFWYYPVETIFWNILMLLFQGIISSFRYDYSLSFLLCVASKMSVHFLNCYLQSVSIYHDHTRFHGCFSHTSNCFLLVVVNTEFIPFYDCLFLGPIIHSVFLVTPMLITLFFLARKFVYQDKKWRHSAHADYLVPCFYLL